MKRSPEVWLCLLVTLGLSANVAPAQTTINVELEGIKFTPADITIEVGDTVHWLWINGFHNVESGIIVNLAGVPDGNFRSGDPTLTAGTTFNLIFDQAFLAANPMPANTYTYYCIVHAGQAMAGTVTVQQQAPECTQDSDCLDTDLCDGRETCVSNACVAGTTLDCDDGIACTADSCNATAGCQNVADAAACNDNNACTDDVCNTQAGCQNTVNTASCDDGNTCTANDTCAGGVCSGTAVAGCCANDTDCDDVEPCTADSCVNGRCVNTPSSGCMPCTSDTDCDDNNGCTDNSCVAGQCQFDANTAACDDADPCTSGDVCASGVCAGTAMTDCCTTDAQCDDGDACTTDACDNNACTNIAVAGCGDGTGGGNGGTTDGGSTGGTTTGPCGTMSLIGIVAPFLGLGLMSLFRRRRR